MLGVLIVDDEAIVRMNLKSMIDWEKEGFYILGEAENGKTGLDLILREKPDIVITDVKMPVMDGLEMISSAKKVYDGARYVILSSYEEFALLKTAMKYGVAEYLLKLELTQAILKKTLENQREALLREKDTLPGREMSAADKAARILGRVLAGHDAGKELENLLEQAGLDPRKLACIAIRFSSLNKKNSFGEEDHRALEAAAQSIVNDITKPYFRGISFLADARLCLFVYSPRDSGAKVREMCALIIQMLRHNLNLAAAAGISSMEASWLHVSRLMIDAAGATEEVFFKGYGIVVFSAEVEAAAPAPLSTAAYDWAEPYRQALELRQAEKLKKTFQKIHCLLTPARSGSPPASSPPRARLSRAEAFNLCFSMAGITLSVLKKKSGDEALFDENLYETIGVIETLEGLREWMRSFEAKIFGFFDSLPQKSHEDYIVIAAKRYVAENCRRPISLNAVAKDLAISAGYLSTVFKRRTNTGFVEYVTRVKMDEAKNLLLSGQYKIYEVSDMVGYEDNGYFIKTFRKVTGMTPGEFVKKNL